MATEPQTKAPARIVSNEMKQLLSRPRVKSAAFFAATCLALMFLWVYWGSDSFAAVIEALAKATPEGRRVAFESLGLLALMMAMITGTAARLLGTKKKGSS